MAETNEQQTPPADAGTGSQAENPSLVDSAPAIDYAGKPYESFFDNKGNFSTAEADKFFNNLDQEKAKTEGRILDLRRTISKGEAPKDAKEYFQDYAPKEKFLTFFDKAHDNNKKLGNLTDELAKVYHENALNKEQGYKVTETILNKLEEIGYLDTRSDTEKMQDAMKFVETEKQKLGNDANRLIAEARNFVDELKSLSDDDRMVLKNLMDTRGASMVNLLHKMKSMFVGRGGDIPTGDLTSLGSLPSDRELQAEYMKPETSQQRRDEIIFLRNRAGRSGKLFDSTY